MRLPEQQVRSLMIMIEMETTDPDPASVVERVERELKLQFRDGVKAVVLVKA